MPVTGPPDSYQDYLADWLLATNLFLELLPSTLVFLSCLRPSYFFAYLWGEGH